MSIDRLTRVNELIKREIGEALFHISADEELDLSAITITNVSTSSDLRNARVMVSIRDHQAERPDILNRLSRMRGKIQKIINKNMTLKYTPCLIFELDNSVEKGDQVLGIIKEIETQMGIDEEADQPDNSENK